MVKRRPFARRLKMMLKVATKELFRKAAGRLDRQDGFQTNGTNNGENKSRCRLSWTVSLQARALGELYLPNRGSGDDLRQLEETCKNG
jgi:hypothetical protein